MKKLTLIILLLFTMSVLAQGFGSDRSHKREVDAKNSKIELLDKNYRKAKKEILEDHIKNLKKILVRSMKEGNLDLANKINAEIKKTENSIKAVELVEVNNEFVASGTWKEEKGSNFYLKPDGTSSNDGGAKGKWTFKNGVLTIEWVGDVTYVYSKVSHNKLQDGVRKQPGVKTRRINDADRVGRPLRSPLIRKLKSIDDIYE